jgi:hypothetical protein
VPWLSERAIAQILLAEESQMERGKFLSGAVALAVGAALLLTLPVKASADDHSGCQHRVERAQEHYRHEVHEHGRHSRQADDAKAKLNAVWERCWNNERGWYDPQRHEWRTDRDWDRNYDWDHDGDRDRH